MLFKTSQVHRGQPIWIACLLIVAASAFVPLPGTAFTLPKLLLFSVTALLAIAWILLSGSGGVIRLFWTRLSGVLFVLFFASVLCTSVLSLMPVVSFFGAAPRFEGLLTYFLYASFLVIGVCLLNVQNGSRVLMQAIVGANTILVLYGFLQFFGADPLAIFWADEGFLGRTFSLAGQPNALAAFIVLTLPVILHIAVSTKHADERRLLLLLSTVNVVVLITTASRSGMIGFAVALVLITVLHTVFRTALKKTGRMGALLLSLICIGFAVVALLSFGQRFFAESSARSTHSRMVIWSDVADIIVDYPLGIGPDVLGVVYPQYKDKALLQSEQLRTGVDRAHSKPLDILLIAGPIGLLSYYGAFVVLIIGVLRQKKPATETSALIAAIAGLHTIELFSFGTILTNVFLWLLTGWLLGSLWRKQKTVFKPTRSSAAVLFFLGLCTAFTIVTTLQWFLQQLHLQAAEQDFVHGHLSKSAAMYAYAVDIFLYDRAALARATETYIVTAQALPDGPMRQGLLQMAQDTLLQMHNLSSGHDPMVPLLAAWRAAVIPDAVALRELAEAAKNRMPTTVDTYRILAQSFRMIGDTAAAHKMDQELLRLLPENWEQTERSRILLKENPWLRELLLRNSP